MVVNRPCGCVVHTLYSQKVIYFGVADIFYRAKVTEQLLCSRFADSVDFCQRGADLCRPFFAVISDGKAVDLLLNGRGEGIGGFGRFECDFAA